MISVSIDLSSILGQLVTLSSVIAAGLVAVLLCRTLKRGGAER
jgi:hypothetical protein